MCLLSIKSLRFKDRSLTENKEILKREYVGFDDEERDDREMRERSKGWTGTEKDIWYGMK